MVGAVGAAEPPRVVKNNNAIHIFSHGKRHELFAPLEVSGEADIDSGDAALVAPMPCKISQVNVKEGDLVKKGQTLLVLEAMKMENTLKSSGIGKVKTIHVVSGAVVEKGAPLFEFE